MYAKLFSSITESSLWSEPKEVRLLFVTMIAKADAVGFVEASLPGLARIANLTLEETSVALEVLKSPDKYSKNPDNEGRRIIEVPGGYMLLNYEGYRARRSEEERREYMRDYMKEYRQRKLSVNNRKQMLDDVNHGKPPLAQAEAEAEADNKQEIGDEPLIPDWLKESWEKWCLHIVEKTGSKIGSVQAQQIAYELSSKDHGEVLKDIATSIRYGSINIRPWRQFEKSAGQQTSSPRELKRRSANGTA